ncbi:hypothetical protein RFI_17436 [Reticulomyxa filosa]|uniref:Fe2OG dioxygenase domain-containing protein n=1 Tax=Reticulomyxa filosa TaxID=46433 RepID=X6N221_RETFI|nr:hypothetical protein RFI_17436 [Reticulomyxa filosa]|eukprot:ETO19794.1 hypothetical protein RFI_17436 [Reticulomyxa filosa]
MCVCGGVGGGGGIHQKALYSKEFCDLLEEMTGITVANKPDLFASVYRDGNYLLCHDDQIDTRAIAFILYLTPKDWTKEDGGRLNIYKSVNEDIPDMKLELYEEVLPVRNSVILFEVCKKSFHEVSEVLTKEKDRIAIGGWFHHQTHVPVISTRT